MHVRRSVNGQRCRRRSGAAVFEPGARWKRIARRRAGRSPRWRLAFAWMATPHYKAETRILIETRESVFTRPDSERRERTPDARRGGRRQPGRSDLVDRHPEAGRAASSNLARLPEFDDAADMSTLSRLLVIAGLKSDPNEIPPEERVLKAFREKLSVYRVEKSRVIVIEMSSEDPKLAAEIPNALADAYLAVAGRCQAAVELRCDRLAGAGNRRPVEARQGSRAEGRELSRSQSDLLIGQNNSVLATQQLSELSTELSRVRANRGAAEANAESVRAVLKSGGSLDALPDVLSSTLIQRLRERQVQLKADIADLSTTLLDNHPRIRALRSQLADLDRQIRTEAENVLKGLGAEARTAQLRETAAGRRPQHAEGRVGARRRGGSRTARAGARGDCPARTAGILSDPLTARRPRAATATICRPMPASSRARSCRRSPISRKYCRSSARPSSPRCWSWPSSRCCRNCFPAAPCARRPVRRPDRRSSRSSCPPIWSRRATRPSTDT